MMSEEQKRIIIEQRKTLDPQMRQVLALEMIGEQLADIDGRLFQIHELMQTHEDDLRHLGG